MVSATLRFFLLQRYMVGRDGMTAYRRLHHKEYQLPAIEFGETLHFKKIKTQLGPQLNKYDSTWEIGILVGIRARSQEFMMANSGGIHKARSVRRLPVSDRWPADSIDIITDVPWDFRYGDPAERPADEQLPEPIAADSGERLQLPLAEGEMTCPMKNST